MAERGYATYAVVYYPAVGKELLSGGEHMFQSSTGARQWWQTSIADNGLLEKELRAADEHGFSGWAFDMFSSDWSSIQAILHVRSFLCRSLVVAISQGAV